MNVKVIKLEQKKNILSNFTESYRQISPYLGLGTQLAVTITLLTLLGKFLDDHFLTKPLFILIGAFLGASAGLYNFIKSILTLDKNHKTKKIS
jgi:F0F1-type ATP synthase assembly protein I